MDTFINIFTIYLVGFIVISLYITLKKILKKEKIKRIISLIILLLFYPIGLILTIFLAPFVAGQGEHIANLISIKLGGVGFILAGLFALNSLLLIPIFLSLYLSDAIYNFYSHLKNI